MSRRVYSAVANLFQNVGYCFRNHAELQMTDAIGPVTRGLIIVSAAVSALIVHTGG